MTPNTMDQSNVSYAPRCLGAGGTIAYYLGFGFGGVDGAVWGTLGRVDGNPEPAYANHLFLSSRSVPAVSAYRLARLPNGTTQ